MTKEFKGLFGHVADETNSIPKDVKSVSGSLAGATLKSDEAQLALLESMGHAVATGRFDVTDAIAKTHAAKIIVTDAGGGIQTDASRVATADGYKPYKPQADNERMFGRSDPAPKTPVGLG
jgi:hypothetical protein